MVIDQSSGKYWSKYILKVSNKGTDLARVSLVPESKLPESLIRTPRICETRGGGDLSCKQPVSNEIMVELAAGETKKIWVFAHANHTISQKPVANRIYVEARDQAGEVVAKNSIGVYTVN